MGHTSLHSISGDETRRIAIRTNPCNAQLPRLAWWPLSSLSSNTLPWLQSLPERVTHLPLMWRPSIVLERYQRLSATHIRLQGLGNIEVCRLRDGVILYKTSTACASTWIEWSYLLTLFLHLSLLILPYLSQRRSSSPFSPHLTWSTRILSYLGALRITLVVLRYLETCSA